MQSILVVMICLACVPSDTTVVLASRSLDLTGDGEEEVLELVGKQTSPDSLELTLFVRATDRVLYEAALSPLTRGVGFDGPRRRLSAEQYRERVEGYGSWLFGDEKFRTATEFELALRSSAPRHADSISLRIAQDSRWPSDLSRASETWRAIKERGGIVFEYSPGGDALLAIAWSQRDGRFYRLLECC